VLAPLVVVFLALSGMEMFPFELQFQLVVEVTTMGCGSTLTATFVRLALGACQDWKCGGKVAPKIIAAGPMLNKAKPFSTFLWGIHASASSSTSTRIMGSTRIQADTRIKADRSIRAGGSIQARARL
jgi:hypothetical protein